jgi:hypothetical protein
VSEEKWIEVNGAKIEVTYFNECVALARELDWVSSIAPKKPDHSHCSICNITLSSSERDMVDCFTAKEDFLCQYCFENFLK